MAEEQMDREEIELSRPREKSLAKMAMSRLRSKLKMMQTLKMLVLMRSNLLNNKGM